MIKKLIFLKILFNILASVSGKLCKSTDSAVAKDITLIRNRIDGFIKSKAFLPSDPSIPVNYYSFENDTHGYYIALGVKCKFIYQLYDTNENGNLILVEGHFAMANPETNEYDRIFEFHLHDNNIYHFKSLTTEFSIELTTLDVDADGFEKDRLDDGLIDLFVTMKGMQIDAHSFIESIVKGSNYVKIYDTEATDIDDWLMYMESDGEMIDERQEKNGDIKGFYVCGDNEIKYEIVDGAVQLTQ